VEVVNNMSFLHVVIVQDVFLLKFSVHLFPSSFIRAQSIGYVITLLQLQRFCNIIWDGKMFMNG